MTRASQNFEQGKTPTQQTPLVNDIQITDARTKAQRLAAYAAEKAAAAKLALNSVGTMIVQNKGLAIAGAVGVVLMAAQEVCLAGRFGKDATSICEKPVGNPHANSLMFVTATVVGGKKLVDMAVDAYQTRRSGPGSAA